MFLCFSSLSLSQFSFLLMAPKKFVPSKNLIRRRGSSSSSSASSVSNSIRFRDKKAQDDFFENFSNWAIHSECQVILSNIPNTLLPSAFSHRGWASLCKILKRCPSAYIWEFTPTCTPSKSLYLGLLWYSEVHVL